MFIGKRIIRILFITLSFFIVTGTLIYTGRLFEQIANEETEKVKLFAEALKNIANQDEEGLNIYWSVLEMNKNVPILIFDNQGKLIQHKNVIFSEKEQKFSQNELLEKKGMNSKPIEIKIEKNNTQFIYYGYSPTLKMLRYVPFIQITLFILLIFLGFVIFRNIQDVNQNRIWIGLSKETAHQLGTPISSLIAWIELMEQQQIGTAYLPEMKKDIHSLKIVSDRFSNIGSSPTSSVQNIIPLIEETVNYMSNRISRSVKISIDKKQEVINAKINKELFIWVIENLIKNAVDAIIQRGEILIQVSEFKEQVCIDISDTGKGMSPKIVKKIFNPGFSTKKRGWGLGLSLTKRIVKHYHNGRIFVKNSEIGKGTTFRIILPKA